MPKQINFIACIPASLERENLSRNSKKKYNCQGCRLPFLGLKEDYQRIGVLHCIDDAD